MRIRGAKTELEDAGLETDGMVESTAKLREELLALSGVDILQDENTFRSTYDILDELSNKWQDLTDIQRASITELIAGKRQGKICPLWVRVHSCITPKLIFTNKDVWKILKTQRYNAILTDKRDSHGNIEKSLSLTYAKTKTYMLKNNAKYVA